VWHTRPSYCGYQKATSLRVKSSLQNSKGGCCSQSIDTPGFSKYFCYLLPICGHVLAVCISVISRKSVAMYWLSCTSVISCKQWKCNGCLVPLLYLANMWSCIRQQVPLLSLADMWLCTACLVHVVMRLSSARFITDV
jgi:hypothetical protein